MHVNVEGLPIYLRRFAAVEPFYNGQARVERFDGALELIDESGTTLKEIRPARRSDFAQLSGDMVGFWRTQTISAAVQLGIAEALPATATEVAARCGLVKDGAYRLLRSLGELKLTEAKNGGCWRLTTRGEFLRRDHPLSLADAAIEYAGPFTEAWKELPKALSVTSQWSPPDAFTEVAEDDSRCVGHHRMLRSYARHDYPLVVDALDFSHGDRVVDAGGGLGALSNMVIAAYPSLSVTVFDRPEVIEMGQREATVSGIKWQAGDLFEPWRLQADVVLLSRVLHDWDDGDALRILNHAHQALSPGGRVYIIEMLMQENRVAGAMYDLHLLMLVGGRERSSVHYERLLIKAGFKPVGVHHLATLPSIVVGEAL